MFGSPIFLQQNGQTDQGRRAVPFQGIFVSNFRCCVFAVCSQCESRSVSGSSNLSQSGSGSRSGSSNLSQCVSGLGSESSNLSQCGSGSRLCHNTENKFGQLLIFSKCHFGSVSGSRRAKSMQIHSDPVHWCGSMQIPVANLISQTICGYESGSKFGSISVPHPQATPSKRMTHIYKATARLSSQSMFVINDIFDSFK
jgi:hypothetical protein